MKPQKVFSLVISIQFMLGYLVACSSESGNNPTATSSSDQSVPPLQGREFRQWAVDAEASSEFADPEWAAIQATNAPDTPRCGDYQTAWSTAGSDKVETIELGYAEAVHATGINIVQSFNPNQVVLVELVGVFDRAIIVFEGRPTQVDQPCPYTLSISFNKTEGRFSKVRITVDQSVLGLGWNQIDAVELIGDTD